MSNPKVEWAIWCDPTSRTKRWAGQWADGRATYSSKEEAQKAVDSRDKWCWDWWTFSVKKFPQKED